MTSIVPESTTCGKSMKLSKCQPILNHPEKRHAYAPERIVKFKSDSSLSFEEFFHMVCSSIENEQAIIDLRKARGEIIEATEELERYLKAKIDFIFKKYEGKLAKV